MDLLKLKLGWACVGGAAVAIGAALITWCSP